MLVGTHNPGPCRKIKPYWRIDGPKQQIVRYRKIRFVWFMALLFLLFSPIFDSHSGTFASQSCLLLRYFTTHKPNSYWSDELGKLEIIPGLRLYTSQIPSRCRFHTLMKLWSSWGTQLVGLREQKSRKLLCQPIEVPNVQMCSQMCHGHPGWIRGPFTSIHIGDVAIHSPQSWAPKP